MGLIDILLLILLTSTAMTIILLHNLFAAVMVLSIFSLLSACLFVLMDAVDVAFTEAAVGAGISTMLMLGALNLTSLRERAGTLHFQWLPFVVVLLTGAALVFGTLDMPHYGDASAPVHQHVAPRYIQQSSQEIDVPNVVTSVLASYRGFDTFGEVAVVFTAAIGILLLLATRRRTGIPVKEDPS